MALKPSGHIPNCFCPQGRKGDNMQDGFIKVAAVTPRIRVADTEYNAQSIIDLMVSAAASGIKLAVFPELCVTGSTCGDLLSHRTLLNGALEALGDILEANCGLDMLAVVGLPLDLRGSIYNCAAVMYDGQLLGLVPKVKASGVFASGRDVDEMVELFDGEVALSSRILFEHANVPELILGVEIGSDSDLPEPPAVGLALRGATVIACPSAIPELVTGDDYRRMMLCAQSARLSCAYIHAEAGNGESTQDLVFSGHNYIAENGELLAECMELGGFEGMLAYDVDVDRLDHQRRKTGLFGSSRKEYTSIIWGGEIEETNLWRWFAKSPFIPEDEGDKAVRCEKILDLQSLGLRKRMEHTNAQKLVVGVSGGLDSTLAILICARALDMLGRDRSDLIAVTMPGFGTTQRTRTNADTLAERLGAELRVVSIAKAVEQHFADIGHDMNNHNVVYENSQARERTQVLMDIANGCGGMVVGTGDLSELALGWATYNGDHMSMYGVNGGIPKTMMRHLVAYYADTCGDDALAACLRDVLDTPVSPELLPAKDGEISQKTEDLVGPYELHDFYLYYALRWGFEPQKVLRMARYVFAEDYADEVIVHWIKTFYRRFFNQQFKRSCLPDGPKVGTLSLSPRGDWNMPTDAMSTLWLSQLEDID